MNIDFIGIGAPKCATSWIFKCLKHHPKICTSSGKETNFFLEHKNPQADIAEYEKWFSDCVNEDVKGEYSVKYFTEETEVPERIHSISSNIKLIISVRDPVERALSHIRHAHSQGRLSENLPVHDLVKEDYSIVKDGLYAQHLKRWLGIFERDQFHIIFFEDIKKSPKSVIKNLYGFLELDDSFEPDILDKKYNTSAARSSKLFWWMNKAYLKLQNIPGGFQLIDLVRTTGLNTARVEQMLGAGEDQDDQFSKEEKDWLYEEYFKEDIEKLEEMLDKDLSSWER